MNQKIYDVVVIGAGPAGLTAGIYLARAKKRTLILNEGAAGGQMVLTHEIANYPGIEATSGYQLASTMRNQAKKFGCEIRSNIAITALELSGQLKTIEINHKETVLARAVILATGGKPRTLGVPGETTFRGTGISYCATCDGDFFQDRRIVVVGGGNSALEEAVSLTKYASSVLIIHQFDHFQAFPHAVEEARRNPKISFLMKSTVAEFLGKDGLEAVSVRNLLTGELTLVPTDGAFIFIGYMPNTEAFADKVHLNEAGEIVTDSLMRTSVDGVFAAGDSIQKRYRQITTAVADGTIAALSAVDYLQARENAAPSADLEPAAETAH
jgi:thioredoxin reductase (NADPH)